MIPNSYNSYSLMDLVLVVLRSMAQATSRKPTTTQRLTGSDAAQALPDSLVKDANGNYAGSVLITCEDNDVRFTISATTPTQGASAVGHILRPGDFYTLDNPNEVANFRFLNRVSGSVGIIQATAKF